MGVCSTVVIHGLQEDSLLRHGLQGSLCSGAWSTFPFPPPLTLSAGLFLPKFSQSLSQLLCLLPFPHLGMLSSQLLGPVVPGSGSARAGWNGLQYPLPAPSTASRAQPPPPLTQETKWYTAGKICMYHYRDNVRHTWFSVLKGF